MKARDLPDAEWLDYILQQDRPFIDDGGEVDFDISKVQQERPLRTNNQNAKIDLTQFFSTRGIRYTCPMCLKEYETADVKKWWIEPGHGKTPVPCCPECGICSDIVGWGIDFSFRHKWFEKKGAKGGTRNFEFDNQ